ncbi:MAG: type III pantothenate kinase [Candidatus Gastranaerophilales bacterium]|nr:type III pantothenate kinase [Candidatus Gastranaerophilales bacterium]
MLLALDIGNSSISIGIFKENKLVKTFKVASDKKRSCDEYGAVLTTILEQHQLKSELKSAVIASVVLPLTDVLKEAIDSYLNIPVFKITSKVNTGVKYKVDNPKEIGADRIANARAAYELYGKPCVVVDFGTATNFDVVSKEGEFLGGVIAPGLGISANALSTYTSLLPKVKIEKPSSAIGKNTIDNILSGLVIGHAKMIDGMIEEIEKELGEKVITIATGGYSDILESSLNRRFDYINPNLTLEGLRLIYNNIKS